MLGTILAATAVVLVLYMIGLWVVSLHLGDVSIVDLGWPVGFVIVAWIAHGLGDGSSGRRLLLATLVSVWAARLLAHLLVRKLAEPGEDPRYTALRQRRGPSFTWTSLGVVFLAQGALIWAVGLPVQAAGTSARGLGPLDLAGTVLWAIGLAIEAVGDEQLRRFKANPARRGSVLDTGLWRLSRHPNYFGDCLVWWGIYLVALSAGAWWTIVGPLLMTTLLLKVSGVRLLEARLAARPGYADYVARTSAFVPLPPRGSRR